MSMQPFQWHNINAIISFGDSWTTTSNNLANILPSHANPLGVDPSQPKWGHTSAGGPNYIYDLTVHYNESRILTYNMAQGGATVDEVLIPMTRPTIKSFNQQIEQIFVPYVLPKRGHGWKPYETLFTVYFGLNDIGKTSANHTKNTPEFYGLVMDEYFAKVRELYHHGMRSLLIVNVPPIDHTPRGGVSILKDVPNSRSRPVKIWNELLHQRVEQLRREVPKLNVFEYDLHAAFWRWYKDPSSIGVIEVDNFCEAYQYNDFKNPFHYVKSCVWSVDKYFWLNGFHVTWTVHKAIAADVYRLLK